MNPVDRINKEERIIENVKTNAKSFLGRGYNRIENRLLEKTLEDFGNDNIDITKGGSKDIFALGFTKKKALSHLDRELKLQFHLNFPATSFGISPIYSKEDISKSSEKKIVYIVAHIDYHKCTLARHPARIPLNSDNPRLGDSFVNAIWLYTGFKVYFEITCTHFKKQAESGSRFIGNFGWKILDTGPDLKIFHDELGIEEVKSIKMCAESFGSTFSICSYDQPDCDLDTIRLRLTQIWDDYLGKSHTIRNREYLVDNECLADYSMAPKPLEAQKTEYMSPIDSKATSSVNESKRFYDLATQIKEGSSEDYKKLFPTMNMGRFLVSIESVFSIVFQGSMKTGRSDHTLVVGTTGRGKSTLIGYQLGLELQLEGDGLGKRYIYKSPKGDYPLIGNSNSKTKGFRVYQNYIDTGGLFDTSGIEEDICNAMAVCMGVKWHCPKRLILFLNLADFTVDRAKGLLDTIKLLQRIVRNPRAEQVSSSILFLVNEHTNTVTMKDLMDSLDRAISAREEERNKLLGRAGLSQWINSDVWERDAKDKIGKVLSQEQAEPIFSFQEQIQILKDLKSSEKRILIADFSKSETREKIEKWEKDNGGLSSESFMMNNLVTDGDFAFKTILRATATFFNCLFTKKTELNESFTQLYSELKRIDLELHKLENLKLQPDQRDNEARKKDIELHDAKIKKCEEEKVRLENIKSELSKEIDNLSKDETLIQFKELKATNPIAPRSFLAYLDSWATTYPFKHEGDVPLGKIDEHIPTKKETYKGAYIRGSSSDDHSQGYYEASYRPAWHNYPEDCNAVVNLLVRKKDHLSTKDEILVKQATIKSLEKLIEQQQQIINGHKSIIKQIEQAKEEWTRHNKVTESNEKMKSEYIRQKNEALDSKQRVENELQNIESKLKIYNDYCKLLVKIIEGLDLYRSANESERLIYGVFCDNFAGATVVKGSHPLSKRQFPTSQVSPKLSGKIPTVGDGNCLIHAIFGEINSYGQVEDLEAAKKRKQLSEDIKKHSEGVTHRTLKSFVHNSIKEENMNVQFLIDSLSNNQAYLGLEHVDLIALFFGLNIVVIDERTGEEIIRFQYTNGPIRKISYNGVNHWSQWK